MPPKANAKEPSGNKTLKVIAALSLIAGAFYLAIGGYQKTQPTAAINNGNSGDGFMGGRGGDMRQEMAAAGITSTQQAALDKAREEAAKSGDWRSMRDAAEKILTEDQRTKMRESRQAAMAARDKKMQAMLSPDDYKTMSERRPGRGGGRGGRGPGGAGGPGGGGGRPEGGPPAGGPPPGGPGN